MLDQLHELPQIRLHKHRREYITENKRANGGGCEGENDRIEVQSCKKTEIEVETEEAVKVQTQRSI